MSEQVSHQLGLEFDYPRAHAGWMKCVILVDGEAHLLEATDVFPPFLGLLRFAKAVALQHFPYEFHWDEEGPWASFEASSIAPNHPDFHLTIRHGKDIWLDGTINRKHVTQTVLNALDDFTANCDVAGSEWKIPRFAFDEVVRVSANPKAIPNATFVMRDGTQYDDILPELRFALWIGESDREYFSILDTSRFWLEWFSFLENVALGQLPVEFTYLDDSLSRSMLARLMGEQAIPPELAGKNIIFRAEPVAEIENFRLMLTRINNEDQEYLALNDVLERNQFVRAFCEPFEIFLQSVYQIFPDRGGKTFDLRSLPLKKLKVLVSS